MADPLSISASIAGLITIADTVFRRTFKYIKAVKEAPKEIATLSSEIGALYGILNSLHLVACQLEGETFDSTIRVHYIQSCYETFEKVKIMLDNYDTAGVEKHSMDSIKRRLKWPFTVSEAKLLIAEIERHKATLGLALTADGMSGLLKALSRQSELQDGVNGIKQELQQMREAKTRVAINEHRQRILDSLGPTDPSRNHETSVKLRHPGTGVWFTDSNEFKQWQDTPHSKLWCQGIPGSGKTVLASSAIQEALRASNADVAVAFFYCDYKDKETQYPTNILGSLAGQIAKQDEQCFEMLQNLYEKQLSGNRMLAKYEPEELRDLIINMTSKFDSTMILVDALDECGDNTSIVVELLASLNADEEKSNVKTLFLSRNEQHIRDWLGHYSQIPIAARSSDLKLYVAAEIETRIRKRQLRLKDQTLKEHIMERLVEGAEGMFRWVTCQMDYLCELPTDAARRKALSSLPPTLEATYERILRRVQESNKYVQTLVQRSLHWIVYSRRTLNVAALCEAISINPGDTSLEREGIPEEDEILRWCSSLVRRAVFGDRLELAHFTVEEYLTGLENVPDSEFGAYRIQSEACNIELAEVCLTYLLLDDFSHINSTDAKVSALRKNSYALRQYAVILWDVHARDNITNEKIFPLVQRLFHPSKSNNFVNYARDFISYAFERFYGFDEKMPDIDSILATIAPLHHAAMLKLPELCCWLLLERCEVNQGSSIGTPLQCAILGRAALLAIWSRTHIINEKRICEERTVSTIKVLLDCGANPNCCHPMDNPWKTLFGIVVTLGWKHSCLEMLRHGAIVDEFARAQFKLLIEGNSRNVSSELDKENLQEDDYARVLELCLSSEGVRLEHAANIDYHSSLRMAAQFGQLDSVIGFAGQTKLNIDAADPATGRTALHLAAGAGHCDIVKFLLEHEADFNIQDASGRTPLHTCLQASETSVLSILLERGSDILAKDHCGYTIWHIAAEEGNLKALGILQSFITGGVDPTSSGSLSCGIPSQLEQDPASSRFSSILPGISQRSADGSSPLHVAVRTGCLEAVRFFVDGYCDLNVTLKDGSNLLHCAVSGRMTDGKPEIVDILLRKGVTACSPRMDGLTPLHLLIQESCSESEDLVEDASFVSEDLAKDTHIRESILSRIADDTAALEANDADGLTVLLALCRRSLDPEYDNLKWSQSAWNILIEKGAQIQPVDQQGRTALQHIGEAIKEEFSKGQAAQNYELTPKLQAYARMMVMGFRGFREQQSMVDELIDPYMLFILIRYHQDELACKILELFFDLESQSTRSSPIMPTQDAYKVGCCQTLLQRFLARSSSRLDQSELASALMRLACENVHQVDHLAVLELFKAGLDPNACPMGGSGTDPMTGGENGYIAILKSLIRYRGDRTITSGMGWTIIHFACHATDLHILRVLERLDLDWNVKVNGFPGFKSLHCSTVLHIAASLPDSLALEYILNKNLLSDIDACCYKLRATALHIAVFSQLPLNVSLLLSRGADANVTDVYGRTPIHIAADLGREDIFSAFWDYRCDFTLTDSKGFTPEMIARAKGWIDLIRLFERHSEMESNSRGVQRSTKLTVSAVQCGGSRHPFKMAIDRGDLSLCQRLIKNKKGLQFHFDFCLGCTPLLYSLHKNQLKIAQFLVDMGASIAGQTCRLWPTQGYTPLHYAAYYGDLELLRCLLDRAARELIDLPSPVHPIHVATKYGYAKCVGLILDRCNPGGCSQKRAAKPESLLINRPVADSIVSPKDLRSMNSLQIAARDGNIRMAELLLKRGALIDFTARTTWTPLHFAAQKGHVAMIKILLEFGANLHLSDDCLKTPCMCAVSSNDLGAFQALVHAGADLQARDDDNCTVLHYAVSQYSWNIVHYLLSTMDNYDWSVEDPLGNSVISEALSVARQYQLSTLLNIAPCYEAYVPQKSNVLVAAVQNINITASILKRLLKRLPQTLLPKLLVHLNPKGETPLYTACCTNFRGQGDLISVLLGAGAALELEGGDHGTPLMGACATGRLSKVKLLVSKGAKISYNKDGHTVSAFHAAKHFPEIKHWLLVGRHTEGPLLLMKDDLQSEKPRTFPKSTGIVLAVRMRRHSNEEFSNYVRLITV